MSRTTAVRVLAAHYRWASLYGSAHSVCPGLRAARRRLLGRRGDCVGQQLSPEAGGLGVSPDVVVGIAHSERSGPLTLPGGPRDKMNSRWCDQIS